MREYIIKAQVVLTPTESKKLIALAVARSDILRKAKIVVLHPSSSTYFIVEALTGEKPRTNIWVPGVIVPHKQGLCSEMGFAVSRHVIIRNGKALSGPGAFAEQWVIRDGKVSVGTPLVDLLEELGPDDVYIKGVNALDSLGNVGVLCGNATEGGTIGLMMSKSRSIGFNIVYPVGLEKLIPGSIPELAKRTRGPYTYGMGLAPSLIACETGPRSSVITEPIAVKMLSGSDAVPMAAGGLGGAEGSVVLYIEGNKEKVIKAVEYVELAKGCELPQVRISSCDGCPHPYCKFPVKGKSWIRGGKASQL